MIDLKSKKITKDVTLKGLESIHDTFFNTREDVIYLQEVTENLLTIFLIEI